MFGYKYTLVNPHQVPEEQIPLMNKVYDLWESCFRPLAEGAGEKFDPDDFFRVDCMGVLMHGENIVGSHFYALFDLRLKATLNHHFFQYLDNSTIDGLIKRDHSRVITLEYTLINKEYRKSQQNIVWAEVLTGLGLKYLDSSIGSGILGTPRIDAKVDKMTYRLNAEVLQEPVRKMNCPCAVVYFPKQQNRSLSNPEVQALVNNLWKSHLNISANTHFNMPKAA
ncbi:hypothetical protein D3C87_123260 [compost metagenome]